MLVVKTISSFATSLCIREEVSVPTRWLAADPIGSTDDPSTNGVTGDTGAQRKEVYIAMIFGGTAA